MRIIFPLILLFNFVHRTHCQETFSEIIDKTSLAVDKNSSIFLCFEYSDTIRKKNQFTTRELRFMYNTRKNPDTLKIIEIFRDSGAFYSPIKTKYYYVKGKPIKKVISRTTPVQEETQTNIYFLKKSEIVQGATLPDSPGWSHKQSAEHMYKVYKQIIKNNTDQRLPGCR